MCCPMKPVAPLKNKAFGHISVRYIYDGTENYKNYKTFKKTIKLSIHLVAELKADTDEMKKKRRKRYK